MFYGQFTLDKEANLLSALRGSLGGIAQSSTKAALPSASELGSFAKRFAAPAAGAGVAYQGAKAISNPLDTANNAIQSNEENPWYKDLWNNATNAPGAILGAGESFNNLVKQRSELNNVLDASEASRRLPSQQEGLMASMD